MKRIPQIQNFLLTLSGHFCMHRNNDKDGLDELPDANEKDAPGERPGTEDGYQD